MNYDTVCDEIFGRRKLNRETEYYVDPGDLHRVKCLEKYVALILKAPKFGLLRPTIDERSDDYFPTVIISSPDVLDKEEELNKVNNRLIDLIREKEPRKKYALIRMPNRAYVIGGYLHDSKSPSRRMPTHDYMYDLDTGVFTRIPTLPVSRVNFAVGTNSRHIAVIGGQTVENQPLRHCARYDIRENIWRSMPDLPAPTSGAGVCYAGNEIHVVGGFDIIGGQTSVVGEYLVYKEGNQRWHQLESISKKRARPMIVVPGKSAVRRGLYSIGGVYLDEHFKSKPMSEIQFFNPNTKHWSLLTTIPIFNNKCALGYSDGLVLVSEHDVDPVTRHVLDSHIINSFDLDNLVWGEGDLRLSEISLTDINTEDDNRAKKKVESTGCCGGKRKQAKTVKAKGKKDQKTGTNAAKGNPKVTKGKAGRTEEVKEHSKGNKGKSPEARKAREHSQPAKDKTPVTREAKEHSKQDKGKTPGTRRVKESVNPGKGKVSHGKTKEPQGKGKVKNTTKRGKPPQNKSHAEKTKSKTGQVGGGKHALDNRDLEFGFEHRKRRKTVLGGRKENGARKVPMSRSKLDIPDFASWRCFAKRESEMRSNKSKRGKQYEVRKSPTWSTDQSEISCSGIDEVNNHRCKHCRFFAKKASCFNDWKRLGSRGKSKDMHINSTSLKRYHRRTSLAKRDARYDRSHMVQARFRPRPDDSMSSRGDTSHVQFRSDDKQNEKTKVYGDRRRLLESDGYSDIPSDTGGSSQQQRLKHAQTNRTRRVERQSPSRHDRVLMHLPSSKSRHSRQDWLRQHRDKVVNNSLTFMFPSPLADSLVSKSSDCLRPKRSKRGKRKSRAPSECEHSSMNDSDSRQETENDSTHYPDSVITMDGLSDHASDWSDPSLSRHPSNRTASRNHHIRSFEQYTSYISDSDQRMSIGRGPSTRNSIKFTASDVMVADYSLDSLDFRRSETNKVKRSTVHSKSFHSNCSPTAGSSFLNTTHTVPSTHYLNFPSPAHLAASEDKSDVEYIETGAYFKGLQRTPVMMERTFSADSLENVPSTYTHQIFGY